MLTALFGTTSKTIYSNNKSDGEFTIQQMADIAVQAVSSHWRTQGYDQLAINHKPANGTPVRRPQICCQEEVGYM